MKRIFSLIVGLVIVAFGVTFGSLNYSEVKVDYYVGQVQMPLPFLLVLTLAIGCLLGVFVFLGIFLRVKRDNYRLRSKLKTAEKEIDNLRSIPLKD
jgi:putative membrane protein